VILSNIDYIQDKKVSENMIAVPFKVFFTRKHIKIIYFFKNIIFNIITSKQYENIKKLILNNLLFQIFPNTAKAIKLKEQ
jgi:hypothetical protein